MRFARTDSIVGICRHDLHPLHIRNCSCTMLKNYADNKIGIDDDVDDVVDVVVVVVDKDAGYGARIS